MKVTDLNIPESYYNGFYIYNEDKKEITEDDVIKWYLNIVFNGKNKPKGAILNSKVEMVKGFLRCIFADPKLADRYVENYWKEKE